MGILLNDDSEHIKGTKKCVIKRELMFNNCKDCQSNDKTLLKSQHIFKSIVTTYLLNKSIRLH